MKKHLRATVLGLALLAAPAGALAQSAAPSAAANAFQATTLSLSATGETRIAPDMATISLGVVAEAATAAQAMQANATRMNAVLASLKRSGLAARDIQTSNMSLEPQYAYEQNQPPRLTGYRASNQVTVTVRDLGKLGSAVDAAVASGANQVNGISFGLAEPTAAENAARQDAVRKLQAKAELYAQATGHRLVRLVSLSEGGAEPPVRPMMSEVAFAAAKRAPTPVSPGELKVQMEVSAVYELAR